MKLAVESWRQVAAVLGLSIEGDPDDMPSVKFRAGSLSLELTRRGNREELFALYHECARLAS